MGPTTGVTEMPSSGDAGETTDTGETTGTATCGDGVVEPGEGCDDGADNGVHAACTDECQTAVCGDGKVQAGVEGCDDGPANSDTGYCRSTCALNVCGDGYLFVGVEACDSGSDNDGTDYGGCDEACTVNRCGDGELDLGHEQCDDGELNGTGRPGEDGIVGCDLDCGFAGRRLFLSSKQFTGDMGSRAGADLACQLMAKDAGFKQPGAYQALLADSHSSPNTWLADVDSGRPFISPSGLVLALDYPALIELGPGTGVTTMETGDVFLNQRAWTGMGPFGDPYLVDLDHTCADWTSNDPARSARQGMSAVGPDEFMQWQTQRWWLSFVSAACDKPSRIYCVEMQ